MIKQLRRPGGQYSTVSVVRSKALARNIAHQYRQEGHSAKVVKGVFGDSLVKTHIWKRGGGYKPPWRR